jgi:hypothetical protein
MTSLQITMKSVPGATDSMTDMGAYSERSPSPVSPNSRNEGVSRSVRSMVRSGLASPYICFNQAWRRSWLGSARNLASGSLRRSPVRAFNRSQLNGGFPRSSGGNRPDRSSGTTSQPAPAMESREFSQFAGDGECRGAWAVADERRRGPEALIKPPYTASKEQSRAS